MATIHCKACGKSYNYEKNGCCPECGAYNRPPRREQVYADGTVHHLDGSSRRPVPNGDKVCYERKENHHNFYPFSGSPHKHWLYHQRHSEVSVFFCPFSVKLCTLCIR